MCYKRLIYNSVHQAQVSLPPGHKTLFFPFAIKQHSATDPVLKKYGTMRDVFPGLVPQIFFPPIYCIFPVLLCRNSLGNTIAPGNSLTL